MADVKISALPASTTPLAGTEVLPIVQSSTTKQVSVANLTAGRAVSASSLTLTTQLSVANGGTGLTSLTAGYIPYGNGTGALSSSADLFFNGSNIGIGTSSPTDRLTVAGNASFSTAAYNFVQVQSGSVTGQLSANGAGTVEVRATTNHPLVLYTNNAERMRITSAGDVGIGTSSPLARLDVAGGGACFRAGSDIGYNLMLWQNTSGGYEGNLASYQLVFFTGSNNARSERMRITLSGDVGIGTTSPAQKLDVGGNIKASGATGSFIGFADATSHCMKYDTTLNGIKLNGYGGVVFETAGANERMRIDSSGNCLLGTPSSPTSGTQCLTIETGTAATASPADTITIYSTDLSAGNTMLSLYTEGTPVNANATAAATHRIAIRVNGTVYYLLANTSA